MKRIALLALVALVVAVVPALATDFTWSGELTYGGSTDGKNVIDAYGNAYLSVKAAADANNIFYGTLATAYAGANPITLTDTTGATQTLNTFTVYLSAIYMQNDLAKILGLGDMMSLQSTLGWIDTGATSYSVSGYGYESLIAYDPLGARDNFQLIAGFGSAVNIQVSLSPLSSVTKTQAFMPQILGDLYGTVGPISYSVAYTNNKTDWEKGLIGASVKYSQAFGDLTPAANVEVSYDLSKTSSAYTLGFGASVAYTSMITVTAGTAMTDKGLKNLGVNASIVPMAGVLGIDIAGSLNMATGAANLINGIDGSVWYMLGKAKLRVGYLYTTDPAAVNASGSLNAPAALAPNGGAYFTLDLTF